MKKLIFLAFVGLACSIQAFAQPAFTVISSEQKTVREAEIAALEKGQTAGKKGKASLSFTQGEIRLVALTGPDDDMLSFRIQGVRNPTLVVPSGAILKVLFINVDEDMKHDIRFGHITAEFVTGPDTKDTVGTEKLTTKSDDGVMQAQEIVIKAEQNGLHKYFCSVGSHAKKGMWGNIVVGMAPPRDLKMPKKATPSEVKETGMMEEMPEMKSGDKKSGDAAKMTGMKNDAKKPGKMQGMGDGGIAMKMSSVSNIGDPMERESSGTSWAPDSSPMYARVKMNEDGSMWMLMGVGFLRYTSIGSSRDVSIAGKGSRSRVDAPTMFMAMYSKPIDKKSQIGFRGMFSLDPIIQQGYGYPLLYQGGEQYLGQPIHDRQHPHDAISELAVTYSYKFNDRGSFYLYAGLPGEPALGPPMFLHRTSGMNNPDAPISHHWQDATHITFGVVTAGFSFGKAKIEASAFNGTEPNENRWNFDKPRLNSFSGRLSWNPTKDWAFQISHAYVRNPEPLEPQIRILRKTTASAIYNKTFDENRSWASTFVWGQNYANGEPSNSFLFESNYDFFKNAVFGRFETVKKSGEDLVLDAPLRNGQYWLNVLSAGYVRDLVQGKGLDVGLGAMATLNHNPSALTPVYGGTTHGGWQVFMRFRPSKAK